jgi:UDP-4-amino-4,6-dideoxy-N-acetyl-beta-L-altrosamine transaminase
MSKIIPYGRHHITESDISAVVDVLKSNHLTQGPKIKEFEEAFANYVGAKYAVAVSNGTAALHLNCMALGVKPGDKVITTPITFSASANCIRYCGGDVIFADIDPITYLLDINSVKKILESSPIGTYKGIIPVDFSGRACNLEEYRELADKYGLWIIEDACHSPGGYFIDSKNIEQKCGNGNFADLAIFSFHPVKHIATGEGGMITTNNFSLYNKLKNLRSHGIQQDYSKRIFDDSAWYYEMQELGFNYRLTDIQSALGLSQLSRAEDNLVKRKKIAFKYYQSFKDLDFIIKQSSVVEGHAYHLYIIEIPNRKELHTYLHSLNILAQIHYIPVHLMPYYRDLGSNVGDFPLAESYYERCISLPVYPTLEEEEQDYVINKILNFYKK